MVVLGANDVDFSHTLISYLRAERLKRVDNSDDRRAYLCGDERTGPYGRWMRSGLRSYVVKLRRRRGESDVRARPVCARAPVVGRERAVAVVAASRALHDDDDDDVKQRRRPTDTHTYPVSLSDLVPRGQACTDTQTTLDDVSSAEARPTRDLARLANDARVEAVGARHAAERRDAADADVLRRLAERTRHAAIGAGGRQLRASACHRRASDDSLVCRTKPAGQAVQRGAPPAALPTIWCERSADSRSVESRAPECRE